MKITLLTQYVPTPQEDYTQLADLTIPNRDEWCNRHVYQHIVQRGHFADPGSYYAFDRLKLLRHLLDQPGAADVFWVYNVQGVITNLTRRLEPVIDDEHDFWITKDCHGINAGSFLVRNTPWSRQWLDFVIGSEAHYRNDSWKEQRCIQHWWQHEHWTWMIHLLPQRAINSYDYGLYHPWPPHTPGNWIKGDLCLSLPGLNLQQRLKLVTEILAGDKMIR